jgi:hypothetical protein
VKDVNIDERVLKIKNKVKAVRLFKHNALEICEGIGI